ncbi:glycosyltransferase [Aquiluna sp.]|nr:glycosyltransferase [Aquiluna sp.]
MRILFLHEVGYLEKPIFEMHEFPEHLSALGHEVAFTDYPEEGSVPSTADKSLLIPGRVLSNVNLRLYSQKPLTSGTLGRLLAAVGFPFFFMRVLRDFQPDLVVSFAVPTSGWQAALICRYRGIPLIFRALDVSHKIRKTLFSPAVKFAERVVYSKSRWVSCNNPAMLAYCTALGAKDHSSSVDYPPLDLSHFLKSEIDKDIRLTLGIPDGSPVILYMGSFFYFSGLAEVIRELSLLEDRPYLVLIGGGEEDSTLREITRALQLEQFVKFTGFVEFGMLPAYLSIADVAINPMVPSLVSHKALPNKVLQYMASGLPVVTTKLEGLNSVFSNHDGIRQVFQPQHVLTAAMDLLNNPRLKDMGESNRKLVEGKFGIGKAIRSFEQRLISLERNKS